MQLVRGEGLRKRLARSGSLPWQLACEVIEQIADAVAAAHAAGIVHRDLKPENVVLEGEALHVKVLDFGIAHLRAGAAGSQTLSSGAPLTQIGAVMGTPGYMAPEQATGQPVDERADVYALGVMLWELIVGVRPFDGASFTEIVAKQFAGKAPELPAAAQPVPQELAAYLTQLLAVRPEERPASAGEVRDRLRVLRTLRAAPARLADAVPRPTRWLAALGSRPKLAAVLGVLVLTLLWSVLSGDGAEPTSEAEGKAAQVEDTRRQAEPRAAARSRPAPREEAEPQDDEPSAAERTGGQEKGGSRESRPLRTRLKRAVNSIFR
jgi:serine/threonine-protein kinase